MVSTVQGGPDLIIDAQLALLRAAKKAGARRFIPSDYSFNFFTLPEGVNVNSDWRRTLAQLAEQETSASFEVVHVMQGIFTDAYVLGFLGVLDGEKGVGRSWGDGKTPIDWTTWEDTARFTAAAAIDERPVPSQPFTGIDSRGERLLHPRRAEQPVAPACRRRPQHDPIGPGHLDGDDQKLRR